MLSLTGRLSESYSMQEKLAAENADLEGLRLVRTNITCEIRTFNYRKFSHKYDRNQVETIRIFYYFFLISFLQFLQPDIGIITAILL